MYTAVVDTAIENLKEIHSSVNPATDIDVHHFIGGPCEPLRAIAVAVLRETTREVRIYTTNQSQSNIFKLSNYHFLKITMKIDLSTIFRTSKPEVARDK